MIPFPLQADVYDSDVQVALTALAVDLSEMLSGAPIPGLDLIHLALAMCCVVPGSSVQQVVLQSSQYFLALEPTEPVVLLVLVHSLEGVSELEWPISPPQCRWTSEAEQHAAAAAFMASVCS